MHMEDPGFWDDPEKSQIKLKELKALKDSFDNYNELVKQKEDAEIFIEMAEDENDASLIPEIAELITNFKELFDKVRISTLLCDEYDSNNAILRLNAGAGGTESCDWASMLLRMYTRWAESKGYSIDTLDYLDGDEAGVKSVTIQVNGENAYGYLKSEKGVHRLVRISPFNANGKRQTSSAIRITHIPTGTVVQCQNERSQHQNKDKAMQMLKAKLYLLKQQENADKEAQIRGEVKEIGWGSQIRSYVLQPYTLVKDHRTNAETGNAQAVLDGDIDLFLGEYLKWIHRTNKED